MAASDRDARIRMAIRVTPEQYQIAHEQARARGVTVSALMREQIDAIAAKGSAPDA